ncbi:hypothetical protein FGB62_662g00 [Gracilaria domingensis]|nr:hypothetical protein FGB62_662g00 [Gracilaria domingensis]
MPSLRESLENLVPFRGITYISVHARLGRGLGENTGRFDFKKKGLPLRSVSKFLCISALKHGHERVFVAADTDEARKWVEAGIHDVLPQADVAHSSIRATHLKTLHSRSSFFEAREKWTKFEGVFSDLGVLALAESMVFFRSGFADAGWTARGSA